MTYTVFLIVIVVISWNVVHKPDDGFKLPPMKEVRRRKG